MRLLDLVPGDPVVALVEAHALVVEGLIHPYLLREDVLAVLHDRKEGVVLPYLPCIIIVYPELFKPDAEVLVGHGEGFADVRDLEVLEAREGADYGSQEYEKEAYVREIGAEAADPALPGVQAVAALPR